MKIARWLVLLSVLLALAVARAQDSDEFDVPEREEVVDEGQSPASGSIPPQFAARPAVTTVLKSMIPFQRPENFVIEASILGFLFVFFANYFLGKRQNRALVDKWLGVADPLLQKQFSYTALSGEPKLGVMEESLTNFKYFCTGRRFCTRFIVDFDLASRQDLFARVFRVAVGKPDYVTFQVGLDSAVVDPFVLSISKKLAFNELAKEFPELISAAKRTNHNNIPSSMCVTTDNADLIKPTLTPSFQKLLAELDDLLEFFVITDLNKALINGFPKTEHHVLTVRFKMHHGSKKLDAALAVQFVVALIDGVGSTIKLSANAKQIAVKRRWKMKQEEEVEASASQQEEILRRQAELREKKQKEYESLSYEEQQKLDALNEKKMARKRMGRKK